MWFLQISILAGCVVLILCLPSVVFALDPMFETTFLAYEVAGGSGRMVAEDFNNDGFLDVVNVNFPSTQFTVELGNGDGSFAPYIGYVLPYYAADVATGDFDGDGDLDLALTLRDGNAFAVWLGNGDGTFFQLTNSGPTDTRPFAIATGYLNNDAYLDLAITNPTTKTLTVNFGVGDGTFGPKTSYATWSGGGGADVAIGYLNGDAFSDIVVLSGTVLSVFLNDGTGHLGPRQDSGAGTPVEVKIVDLNLDSKMDLVVGNANGGVNHSIAILMGNGNGTFSVPVNYPVNTFLQGIAVQDIDKSGTQDILSIASTGTFTTWFGVGNGTFTARADYVTGESGVSVESHDLNGDLWPEVIVCTARALSVSHNRGNGTFGEVFNYPTPLDPYSVATGDLNGDTFPDLGVGRLGGTAAVLLGNGDGTFGAYSSVSTGLNPLMIVLEDFNGDQILDMATSNNNASNISVLMGNGNGTFAPRTDYAAQVNPSYVAAGKFNADNYWDLAVTNQGSASVSIYSGNGDGTFQPQVTYGVGTQPVSIALGDLNHDNRLDIVTANVISPNTMSVLLGNGDGSFLAAASHDVIVGRSVDLGDINGDGHLDAVIAMGGTSVSFVFGDGTGDFGPRVSFVASTTTNCVKLRDLDGDNLLDLTVSNNGYYTITVYHGQGDGTFVNRMDYGVGNGPRGFAIADVNGDGKLDLVSANSNKDNVSVLLNIRSSPSSTSDPRLPSIVLLSPAWPNPFSQFVNLAYDLPTPTHVRLTILDIAGRQVTSLVDETRAAGRYELSWSAHDQWGGGITPGVYLARLTAAGQSQIRKLVFRP